MVYWYTRPRSLADFFLDGEPLVFFAGSATCLCLRDLKPASSPAPLRQRDVLLLVVVVQVGRLSLGGRLGFSPALS
jgi:hypothetical protein